VERAITSLDQKPIIIRLSGHTEPNDRLALREIARQLSLQTGKSYLVDVNADDDANVDDNPFLDATPGINIPPPSHLPALISVLPTLSRPVVVILDAFDLFALHARQALLYCLLDTAQSCRVGQGNNGIAVIGVTTRIDTVNLLEKRVKSRFSGRMLRTAAPTEFSFWMKHVERVFRTPIESPEEEWGPLWTLAVDNFFADRKVLEQIQETVAITRDIRVLQRIMVRHLSVWLGNFSYHQIGWGCHGTGPFITVSNLCAPRIGSTSTAYSCPVPSFKQCVDQPAIIGIG